MSKRQDTQPPPNASRSDPLPSGLSRALDNTGRGRNSSATPVPQFASPTPRREFSRQIDNMNNPNHSRVGSSNIGSNRTFASPAGSPESSVRSGETNTSRPRGQESKMGSGDNSVVTQNSPSLHRGANRNTSVYQSSGTSRSQRNQTSSRNAAPDVQTLLVDFINKVERSGGINPSVKEFLVRDLRAINRQHVYEQSRTQQETERVYVERKNLLDQLSASAQSLDQANDDRERYMEERDDLRQTVQELERKARSTDERINDLKMRWESTNTALKSQLDTKSEQLDSKRAFWPDSNKRSTSRRSETFNSQDPFTSPTPSYAAAFERTQMGSIGSNKSIPLLNGLIGNSYGQSFALGHANPDSGPPNATAEDVIPVPRRRPNLPTSNGYQRLEAPASILNRLSTHNTIITEPRTEPPNMIVPSTALVIHSSFEDPSEKFQNEFSEIYRMLEGWAASYTNTPNLTNDKTISRSNGELWAFMMNCTYPGQRQDSHTHVMALLSDPAARYWFVMRMGVSHIVNDVFSLDQWHIFSAAVDHGLKSVRGRLLERGLAPRARQALVDEQAGIIQSVVSSPQWEGFRSQQLSHHSKKLRDILGPMLNDDATRAIAGRDLGAITLKAWELAIQLNCTPVTVQVYFPETAAKFSAATMIAKDRSGFNPMDLQLKQTRLKLVITPVVTLRDDRHDKIKARNLHYSTVLTMN